jgi:integrase
MASFQTLANGKIQVRIRKKGHLASEVFETLKMAEAWARREETRIDKAEAGIFENDQKITMAELILKWSEANKEQKGFKQVQYHLKKIPNYIQQARIKTMSSDIFKKYKEEEESRGMTAGTINRRLDQLRLTVNWGIRKIKSLQRIHNVIEDIDRPKYPKSHFRDRIATPEEIEQIISKTKSKWFPDFLRLSYETAGRVSEVIGLRWEHINFEKKVARVFDTKNGEDRDIALTHKAVAILKAMQAVKKSDWVFPSPRIKDKPMNGNAATAAMIKARKKVEEKLGYKLNLHTHDIRHTGATRLSKLVTLQKWNAWQLQDQLGHKDPKSTKRYIDKSGAERASTIPENF